MLNLSGPATLQVTVDALNNLLTDQDATSVKLHLYQNNVTPSPGTVLADLVEADFDGYAEKTVSALAYPPAKFMPDGSSLAPDGTVAAWSMTGAVTPNTVYGFYMTDSTDTFLIFSLRFDTPKLMDGPTKFINVEWATEMPAGSPQILADCTSNG